MSAGRLFTGDTLVIATHNKGKVPEIARLLRDYVKVFPSAGDLGLPEPEETEDSFIGNAILKARAAAADSKLPALADDSGLAVAALNGAPGIYSARWAPIDATGKRNFPAAMARVLGALDGKADRSAAFICALALAWPDGTLEAVEGRVDGTIALQPDGDQGFGYDPIFIPQGYSATFARDPSPKDRIGHRADAFRKLVALCFAPAAILNSDPASCSMDHRPQATGS